MKCFIQGPLQLAMAPGGRLIGARRSGPVAGSDRSDACWLYEPFHVIAADIGFARK